MRFVGSDLCSHRPQPRVAERDLARPPISATPGRPVPVSRSGVSPTTWSRHRNRIALQIFGRFSAKLRTFPSVSVASGIGARNSRRHRCRRRATLAVIAEFAEEIVAFAAVAGPELEYPSTSRCRGSMGQRPWLKQEGIWS